MPKFAHNGPNMIDEVELLPKARPHYYLQTVAAPTALTHILQPMKPESGIFNFAYKKRNIWYPPTAVPFYFSPQVGITTDDIAPAAIWTVPILTDANEGAHQPIFSEMYVWNGRDLKYEPRSVDKNAAVKQYRTTNYA